MAPSVTCSDIDHVVVYATNPDRTSAFFADLLGGERVTYGPGWTGVRVPGGQVNVRPMDEGLDLAPSTPTPGAAECCLVTAEPIETVVDALETRDIDITEGPVERLGARGTMTSVYFHDPDGSLIEIATYD